MSDNILINEEQLSNEAHMVAGGSHNNGRGYFHVEVYNDKEQISHSHSYIELIYIVQSDLIATVNKDTYDLHPGDLLVLLPDDLHTFKCKRNSRYISIQSDVNLLFGSIVTYSDLNYIKPYNLSKIHEARVFRSAKLDNEADIKVPKLISMVYEEYTDKRSFYKLALRAHMSYISLYIFREWEKDQILNNNSLIPDNSKSKIKKALDIIETRYMEELTAEQLSRISDMSYSYFSRYFKSVIGCTFSEYLNSVRISASEAYLTDSDMPIAQIAGKVGFANTSYFISQFKKQFHMTPKKYRSTYGIKDNL